MPTVSRVASGNDIWISRARLLCLCIQLVMTAPVVMNYQRDPRDSAEWATATMRAGSKSPTAEAAALMSTTKRFVLTDSVLPTC